MEEIIITKKEKEEIYNIIFEDDEEFINSFLNSTTNKE